MSNSVKFTEENFRVRVEMCVKLLFEAEGLEVKQIPITFSNMSSRNGYFRFNRTLHKAVKLTFARRFLTGAYELEDVDMLILHECIHYMLFAKGYESENHGNIFKMACLKHHCTRDGASSSSKVANTEVLIRGAKYALQCTKCKNVYAKTRMSNQVSNPSQYTCKCGGAISRIK